MHHAVQTGEKSVEFSTFEIESDSNHSKETIAKTLLQTIADYMMEHSDSSLEEIGVVIDNDDEESTTVSLDKRVRQSIFFSLNYRI